MKEGLTIDDCTLCGRCKMACPVYALLRSEQNSPRGWASLKRQGKLHKIYYRCLLCNACSEACPGKIDLGFLQTRQDLEEADITTEQFKKMAMDIIEHGTPYPKNKEGEKPRIFFSF